MATTTITITDHATGQVVQVTDPRQLVYRAPGPRRCSSRPLADRRVA